jgi:pyruvate dehydrogenase (quinone)
VMEGDPKYPGTQWLPDFDYAKYGELCGLKGIYCEKGDDMRKAWEEALSANSPVVLEVRTDPEIPPLPPHITREQAQKMTKAMLSGDPEFTGVMEKSLRGKLVEFLTR